MMCLLTTMAVGSEVSSDDGYGIDPAVVAEHTASVAVPMEASQSEAEHLDEIQVIEVYVSDMLLTPTKTTPTRKKPSRQNSLYAREA